MKVQFLKKDITIRKIDGSFVRGICVNETSEGVAVIISKNKDKIVFVPFSSISEIVTSGGSNQ